MLVARILLVTLLCAPLLAQEPEAWEPESEIPFSAEVSYHLEALILRQQLAETRIQVLYQACYQNYLSQEGAENFKLSLSEAQQETVVLIDTLYEDAGLDPEKYSIDLARKTFVLIEEEVQIAEIQGVGP